MAIEDYKKIKKTLSFLKEEQNNYHIIQRRITKDIEETMSNCPHDFIVVFNEEKGYQCKLRNGQCLICNQFFQFVGKYVDYDNVYESYKIIDLVDIFSKKYFKNFNGMMNLKIAKEKFENIINCDKEYSLEEIKSIIVDSLKEYNDDLFCKKLIKRSEGNE